MPDDGPRARAREALLRALRSQNDVIASEAALALGRVGDARDIATLARIVRDPDDSSRTFRIHRHAALGLGMLPRGNEEQAREARRALVGVLAKATGDNRSVFWTFCAYALAMRGDAAAVPDLVSLRKKGLETRERESLACAEVLGGVCYALGALGGELALPEIEEHLACGRSQLGSKDTTWEACRALARVGGPRAIAILRRAANDQRLAVRVTAIQALGEAARSSDDATSDVLRNALAADADPMCRGMAALALGRIGHRSSVPALLDLLRSGEPHDQPYAALGLALAARRNPGPEVTEALSSKLAEPAAERSENSAFALACGLAGVTAARERLHDLAANSTIDSVRVQAAFALGLLDGGPEDRRLLHELLDGTRDMNVMLAASQALGLLRDDRVIGQLRARVAADDAAPTRAAAILCLGLVGDYVDVEFLVSVAEDPRELDLVRAQAVNALGLVLDRGGTSALARVASIRSHTREGGSFPPPLWHLSPMVY